MARIARVVIPGIAHHIVQRGNRRQRTFFGAEDYRLYLRLLKEWSVRHGVQIWCYCLMPNHTHLVAVPDCEAGLARAIGTCHERYTRAINEREEWTGYLWQGRFRSHPMDEAHLLAAVLYILNNPVKAGLVDHCWDWEFSSARAHLSRSSDGLVEVAPLAERIHDWREFLGQPLPQGLETRLENHLSTGRPLGDIEFVTGLERATGRELLPKRRGRKPSRK